MVRRDGARVRCFTRNGHDWADRFTGIVDAASRIKATSFLIDGEAVITSDDGMSDFRALQSKRRRHEAVLFAFDLLEHDGSDLRDLPLIERKRRLKRLLGRAKRYSIRFVEHLEGDGPTVFDHVQSRSIVVRCFAKHKHSMQRPSLRLARRRQLPGRFYRQV